MNQNHKIDMRRPFAAEYAEARHDVRFWDNLKAPTQQGVAMYFEDATARPYDIEKACGMSINSLRHVLTTRGMYVPTKDQPALRPRSGGNFAWRGVKEHEPNAYKGAKPAKPARPAAIDSAIAALEEQLSGVSTQMRKLNAEWDKLNEALSTLKGL